MEKPLRRGGPYMSKWISGQSIVERWGIEPFELFDHMKKGLQPYSGHGKRIIDSETLPRKRRYTLEEMKGNVRAKFVAGSVLGSGSLGSSRKTESEIEWIAQSAYDGQPLEIVDPPADCIIMSLSLPVNAIRAAEAIQQALGFLFKLEDVLAHKARYEKELKLQPDTFEIQQNRDQTVVPPNLNLETARTEALREIGRKGGSKAKKNKVLAQAIHYILKNKPELIKKSASDMWNHIERTYDSAKPLKTAKGKLYCDGDELISELDGKIRSISRHTFNNYVSEIKKQI